MGFKSFSVRVVIQCVLIALTSGLFFWTLNEKNMLVTNRVLVGVWVFQIYFLIRYVKQIQRDLTLFFNAVKFEDETMIFNSTKNKAFQPMYDSFNHVLQTLKEAKEFVEANEDNEGIQKTDRPLDFPISRFP